MKNLMYVLTVVTALMLGLIFVFKPTSASFVKQGHHDGICDGVPVYPNSDEANKYGFPATNRLEYSGGCIDPYTEIFYDKVVYDFVLGATIVLVPGLYYIHKRGKKLK